MIRSGRRELLIINPNTSVKVTDWLAAEARRVVGDTCEVIAANADSGVVAIRTPADLGLAGQSVVSAIAARPNASGAVIAAFGDPGLKEARSKTMMAIAGLGESGILAASGLGQRFSIITIGPAMLTPILEKVAQLGFSDQLATVRFLPFDVSELIEDRDRMRNTIAAEARAAVTHDGAKVILLGGAPFAGMANSLGHELDIAILDGVKASIDRLDLMSVVSRDTRSTTRTICHDEERHRSPRSPSAKFRSLQRFFRPN